MEPTIVFVTPVWLLDPGFLPEYGLHLFVAFYLEDEERRYYLSHLGALASDKSGWGWQSRLRAAYMVGTSQGLLDLIREINEPRWAARAQYLNLRSETRAKEQNYDCSCEPEDKDLGTSCDLDEEPKS